MGMKNACREAVIHEDLKDTFLKNYPGAKRLEVTELDNGLDIGYWLYEVSGEVPGKEGRKTEIYRITNPLGYYLQETMGRTNQI